MLIGIRVDVIGYGRAVGGWLVVLHDVDLENARKTHFELGRAAIVKAQVLMVN